ncbi:LD-carboxypeptidase [Flavimobilis marinus]|uniref:Muramoyltetrapeptide carboxypeptidase LdcA (Peptidoglycan recycling) n=1 Tax=Flavimobilis marinus TaxID=285351 RepID=A0A1I2I1I4_9MICO|nr:S66 peptidase family protein [Flavimobilis marinus]GHG48627.1 LD-carboxypeptidase [Flavimobilis marinus]SFF36259.1 Muramoyltetrapeptide carboxypeptidase LdcA (peptidoglycan recycling) [Flavimobilis marinus]
MVTFPSPLRRGDLLAVTAPSLGVPSDLVPRLDFAVESLRERGYRVVVDDVTEGEGEAIARGPARERAARLTGLMLDPEVRAVIPPWGGHIAIDLLHCLDFDEMASGPTWLVGFSDVSTLLLPLTLLTGVATLHGQNLMDTPYRVPAPLVSWVDVASGHVGPAVVQGPAQAYRSAGFDDWQADPTVTEYTFDAPGGWTRVDAEGDVDVRGRLIGGCLDTITHLAGTPYGDVATFAATHAPEGLIVYLESAGSDVADLTRRLFGLRYAGWFGAASAVLIGRSNGKELPSYTRHDAVRHALGDLGIPVLVDVDCGHLPPHMALVNGALAELTHTATASRLTQYVETSRASSGQD